MKLNSYYLIQQQRHYEQLIRMGQASLEDYEAYVYCQRTLVLRQQATMTPERARRKTRRIF